MKSRRWDLLVGAIAASALAACSGPDSEDGGQVAVTRSDSAGIPMVEAAPAQSPVWTIPSEPSLTIGAIDGDERYVFGAISSGLFLSDGRIAVADVQSSLLRVYDAAGQHVEDWGGSGEGPGEFSYIWSTEPLAGDSVLVEEIGAVRLSVLGPDGVFARSVMPRLASSPSPDVRPAQGCCQFWGSLADGSFLLSYPEMIPLSGPSLRTAVVTLTRVGSDGRVLDTLGTYPSGQYEFGSDPRRPRARLYGNRTTFSSVPDGFFLTEGLEFEVRRYDDSGRLRSISRVRRPRVPMTDEIRDSDAAFYRALSGTGLTEEGSGAPVEEPLYPDSLPAYGKIVTDRDGNAWAPLTAPVSSREPLRYDVFGPDGAYLGWVALPAGRAILDISYDRVLTRYTDELGVNYAQIFEITKE